jgi:hypothetical protein
MNTDWLKDASPEALRAALISIAEAHNMKEDNIKAYVAGKPSKQRQGLIELVHMAFCTKPHNGEPLPCAFHLEMSAVDPFILPAHLEWALKVDRLLKELSPMSEAELINTVVSAYRSIADCTGTIIPLFISAIILVENPRAEDKIVMIKNIMTGKEMSDV